MANFAILLLWPLGLLFSPVNTEGARIPSSGCQARYHEVMGFQRTLHALETPGGDKSLLDLQEDYDTTMAMGVIVYYLNQINTHAINDLQDGPSGRTGQTDIPDSVKYMLLIDTIIHTIQEDNILDFNSLVNENDNNVIMGLEKHLRCSDNTDTPPICPILGQIKEEPDPHRNTILQQFMAKFTIIANRPNMIDPG